MFNKYSSIAKKTWQRTDNTIALKNDSKHTSQNMDQTRRLNAVGGFHMVVIVTRLALFVTSQHHIHVFKLTFWRSLLTQYAY